MDVSSVNDSGFEELLVSIATRLISIPLDEIDCGIHSALSQIAEIKQGINSNVIIRFFDNLTQMSITHEWCGEKREPLRLQLQECQTGNLSSFLKKLVSHENVCVANVSTLLAENQLAGKWWQERGITSLLLIPMFHEEDLIGCLGLFSSDCQLNWTQSELKAVRQMTDLLTSALVRQKNEETADLVLLNDVTQRKKEEAKIKASLKEKELLLKEIHHRVRNDLQVIISLLRMQAAQTDDKRIHKFLEESMNRVKAMSLIHSHLYQNENLTTIKIQRYLSDLIRFLFQTGKPIDKNIQSDIQIQDIYLSTEQAVTVGLIINEIITNTLEHAFPHQKNGTVKIRLELLPENQVQIMVADDGIGMPADLDVHHTKTLGFQLIVALVEDQLAGNLKINRHSGTCFTILFPRTFKKYPMIK